MGLMCAIFFILRPNLPLFLRPAGLVGLGPGPLRRSTRFWGWPAAQKAESRASGSGA